MPRKPNDRRRQMWDIRQAAPDALDLYIYDDIEADGEDWWSGEKIASSTSANHFRDELAKYPNAAQINIYINSRGGATFEGITIYSQLRRHPAKKTVYVDGLAASAASVVAMAGDRVIMSRSAMMMIHNASSFAYGNAADFRKLADDLDVISKSARQAYLEKAGDKLTEEALIPMLDAETWLTAEDCIRLGLADEYAEEETDTAAVSQMLSGAAVELRQQIRQQQALNCCLRELRELDQTHEEPPEEPPAPPPPAPEPEPQPVSVMERLAAMFQHNEREV